MIVTENNSLITINFKNYLFKCFKCFQYEPTYESDNFYNGSVGWKNEQCFENNFLECLKKNLDWITLIIPWSTEPYSFYAFWGWEGTLVIPTIYYHFWSIEDMVGLKVKFAPSQYIYVRNDISRNLKKSEIQSQIQVKFKSKSRTKKIKSEKLIKTKKMCGIMRLIPR